MTPNLIYHQILAYLGFILLILSPLPQIRKIILKKSVEGVSISMWLMIFLGGLSLLIMAAWTSDTLFAIFLTVLTVENIVILYLYIKYRDKTLPSALSPRGKAQKKDTLNNIEHLLFEGKNKIHLLHAIDINEEAKTIEIAVSPIDNITQLAHFVFENVAELQIENEIMTEFETEMKTEKEQKNTEETGEFPQEIMGIENHETTEGSLNFILQCKNATYKFNASYPIKK